jgi:hypothetical protein
MTNDELRNSVVFLVFNPQTSQIKRITLITLRAMPNLQDLIPRSLLR